MRFSTGIDRLPVVCLTLLALTVAGSVNGQSTISQQRRPKIAQISLLEVQVPVTVKVGSRFVVGLSVADFEVYEDGKPQKIEGFIAPRPFPQRISILADVDLAPFEQMALEDLVAAIEHMRAHDSDLEICRHFTGEHMSLLDDLYHLIEDKPSPGQARGAPAPQLLIALSRAGDADSERPLKDVIESAQRHDVTVFVIKTNRDSAPVAVANDSSEDRDLRILCDETGGQLSRIFEKAQLYREFTRIEQRLRPEYLISYVPENQEKTSGNRAIEIKLIRAEGQIFHKRGYVYEDER